MRLLISTPNFILGYDVEKDDLRILESGKGEYYGISWSPTGDSLAFACSGLDNASLIDLPSYAHSEIGYLTVAGRKSWRFLSAPHQILWVHSDWILATNTGRNALSRVSVHDFSNINYRYDGVLWDRLSTDQGDGSHFNSVFFRHGVVYLVAHNHDRGSYILELAWPSLEKIREHRLSAIAVHNLWISDDGPWFCCDSPNGAIIDARTGEEVWTCARQGYTRGLAATAELVFIGHSDFTTDRIVRTSSESGVWIVDRKTWKTLDYVSLGCFGSVHEIRIWDVPDQCHHGHPLSPDALAVLGETRKAARDARLARLSTPRLDSKVWQARDGGIVTLDLDGFMSSSQNVLTIASLRGNTAKDGTIAADVRVDDRGTGVHASLIGRYQGPGDRNMYAALFQNSNEGIYASIWVNVNEWKCLGNEAIPRDWLNANSSTIPVEFKVDGSRLILHVCGRRLFSINDEHDLPAGDFGVRIFGTGFSIGHFRFTPASLS